MSGRRRTGSWQDEVARSFSRLFSRGTSQDEEDTTEEPDPATGAPTRPESQSSSATGTLTRPESQSSPATGTPTRPESQSSPAARRFFRRNPESQSPARSFSRFFSRSSSQDREDHETDTAINKGNNVNSPAAPERLTPGPSQQKIQDAFLPDEVFSEPEDDKHKDVQQNSKVLEGEKQSRENFLIILGNFFNFSPKTPPYAKPADGAQEPYKEHEDTPTKNTLDEEDSHEDQTGEVSEQTAQAQGSVEGDMEAASEEIKLPQKPPARTKINGHLEAPSVTYGTYRGSRKIRKLLRRRPDTNSPIPEKEENGENAGTDDVFESELGSLTTPTSSELDSSIVTLDQSPSILTLDQSLDDDSSRISIDSEPKMISTIAEDLHLNAESKLRCSEDPSTAEFNILSDLQTHSENSLDISLLNSEYSIGSTMDSQSNCSCVDISSDLTPVSEISEDLRPNIEESLHKSDNGQTHFESISDTSSDLTPVSELSEVLRPNIEASLHSSEVLRPNIEESLHSSEVLRPNIEESLHSSEVLRPNIEESLQSSEVLRPIVESLHSSEVLRPNIEESLHSSENGQKHFERISDTSSDLTLMSELSEVLRPKTEESLHSSENGQKHFERISDTSIDLTPVPGLSVDLRPNIEKNLHCSDHGQKHFERISDTSSDLTPVSELSEVLRPNIEESLHSPDNGHTYFERISDISSDLTPVSELSEVLRPNIEESLHSSDNGHTHCERISDISSDLTPVSELSEVLRPNIEESLQSSENGQKHFERISDTSSDLTPVSELSEVPQPSFEKNLNSLDNGQTHFKMISGTSDTSSDLTPVSQLSDVLRPNIEESLHSSDHGQTHCERLFDNSETLLLPKEDAVTDLHSILRNSLNSLDNSQPNTEACLNPKTDLETNETTNTSLDLSLHKDVADIDSMLKPENSTDVSEQEEIVLDSLPISDSAKGSNEQNISDKLQPNAKECLNHPEDLQNNFETKTTSNVDPSTDNINTKGFSNGLLSIPENITQLSNSFKPNAEEKPNNLEDLQTFVGETSKTLVDSSLPSKDRVDISIDLKPDLEKRSNPNVNKIQNYLDQLQANVKTSDTLVDPTYQNNASTEVSENVQQDSEQRLKNSNDLPKHRVDISIDLKPDLEKHSNILDVPNPDDNKGQNDLDHLQASAKISDTSVDPTLQKNASTEVSENVQKHSEQSLKNSNDLLKHRVDISIDLKPDLETPSNILDVPNPNVNKSQNDLDHLQANVRIADPLVDPTYQNNTSTEVSEKVQKKSEQSLKNSNDLPKHRVDISIDLKPDLEKRSNILDVPKPNVNKSQNDLDQLQANVKISDTLVDPALPKNARTEVSENAQHNSEQSLKNSDDQATIPCVSVSKPFVDPSLSRNDHSTDIERTLTNNTNLLARLKPTNECLNQSNADDDTEASSQLQSNVEIKSTSSEYLSTKNISNTLVDPLGDKEAIQTTSGEFYQSEENNKNIIVDLKQDERQHISKDLQQDIKEYITDLVPKITVESQIPSGEIAFSKQKVGPADKGAEELDNSEMLTNNDGGSIGNVGTSNSIKNECNISSSAQSNNAEKMSAGSFIDTLVPQVKPLLENNVSNDIKQAMQTVRTVSFDNGIECHSPSSTISGTPSSPIECINITDDSPLHFTDAIDSGMVSAQAYTPEEQTPVISLNSEIISKNIYDSFVEQNLKENKCTETEMSNTYNTMPSANLVDSLLKLRNVPSTTDTQTLADANNAPQFVAFGQSSVDTIDNMLTRHSTNAKINEVYAAKVSVKSVNVEEVRLSPFTLFSGIISISKVESPIFEKELISLPDVSPPPEDEAADEFKDLPQGVTNIEVNSETAQQEMTVDNGNTPTKLLEYHSKHTKFPLLYKPHDAVLKEVDMRSRGYITDKIPQFMFLDRSLPKASSKSPDILIENLKNNNLTIDTSDIINASLQTVTSECSQANESLLYNDSLWELRNSDSLSEFHPDEDAKEQRNLGHEILHSTLQSDVNSTDDMNSSGSASPKMNLSSIELSESFNESFEEKAKEIIFSVLLSAKEEFQNINKNTMDIPHLMQEESIGNKLPHLEENHISADDKDPVVSIAKEIVNDILCSSKQFMQNSFDKDIDTTISTTNGNDKEKDTRNSLSVLTMLKANSNVQPAEMLCDTTSDETKYPIEWPVSSNGLRMTGGTTESMQCREVQEKEESKALNGCDDGYLSIEAKMHREVENNSSPFLSFYTEYDESYSKSLETEGSMDLPSINSTSLTEESDYTSGGEPEATQFVVYSSKYVEIESDDEFIDEDFGVNEGATDSYLLQPSRRVKIYPFSLSPIFEDESSGAETLSCRSSPRHKEGTTENGTDDHTSILSLLQSVSDRLMESNMDDTSSGGNVTSVSEGPTSSDADINGASLLEDKFSSTKLNLDVQKVLEEDKTFGGKKAGLFITKSENRWNPVASRQSFLLNLSATSGEKSASEINSNVGSKSSPSPTNESALTPDLSSNGVTEIVRSPTKTVTDSALSVRKSEPRLTSNSIYYQYFHASQNYPNGTENNQSPTEEKQDLPTEKQPEEANEPEMNAVNSETLKFNPRPGKVILSDIVHHDNKIELKGDILDATSWAFPNGVNVRVIRGCWVLYEKPDFEGQAHVLEEGEAVLLHLWGPPGARSQPETIRIGSVKRVVKDYLPEVLISSLEDSSDAPVHIRAEVSSLENLVDKRPRSLTVNSGVWLAYTEPQYTGTASALEEGCTLPCIQECEVKSIRPLKMGGLKVQQPNDPKIIIYEKPNFQGWSREISEHVCSIRRLVGDRNAHLDVGSIQVIGGIWVGYETERFKGHQYLLEEGEYEDWQAWGGYSSTLQSLRYLQANFLEASVTLSESDSEEGKHVDLFNQAIADLELAGHNTRTQCIDVKKGVWVAYQQKHYCGEQYILEKGRYKSYVDWGGSNNTIMSIRPVLLEPLGRNEAKHLIKVYENKNFQGQSADFSEEVSDFASFTPKSLKVLRGCWLLGYQADSRDNVCVLEEGQFSDLSSHGCSGAVIKFIRPIDYVFAEPSISLFALDSCEGRELHFEEAVNSVLHFYAQSVWVRRGLWIAFEGANFLGRQMLLDSQKIPNWSQFSNWEAFGSLRPLKQPAVYFMVRNKNKDQYLTVTGKTSDARATFVCVSSRNGQNTQIWYFSRGLLKSKANDTCLDVIGGKNIPGSKVSLWAEHGKDRQKWKINKDGTIASYISEDLVLDLKGGNYYDQNYLVVNRAQDGVATQKWDIEIL